MQDSTADTLMPQPRPARVPTSHAQRRLWFADQLNGGSPEYHVRTVWRLRGRVDAGALQHAFDAVVDRHETLRTRFAAVDGEPVQIVDPARRVSLQQTDWRRMDPGDQARRVAERIRREGDDPFDLAQGPLLRAQLIRVADDEHVLIRTTHHIVSDGWSEGIFNTELTSFYAAARSGRELSLPRLPIQYADFALWERRWLDGERLERGLAYWRRQLAGARHLTLPTRRRPTVQTFDAAVYETTIEAPQLTAIKRLGWSHQATLYMTLLAAFVAMLSELTGQQDVVVGAPWANRRQRALAGLIGFFVNTCAIRVDVGAGASFADMLASVKRAAVEAGEYQHVPFDRVVEALAPTRDPTMMPIVQVVFVLQNASRSYPNLSGVQIDELRPEILRLRFDVEVHAREHDGRLALAWVFNRDLFDRDSVASMAQQYEHLLSLLCSGRVSDRLALSALHSTRTAEDRI